MKDNNSVNQDKRKFNTSKFPWVIWFKVSIRRKWFSYWWKTRGANFLELQVWIFKISIGMPWAADAVHRFRKDYGSHDHIRETNRCNAIPFFSFKISNRT
jgi:hypothetical protein